MSTLSVADPVKSPAANARDGGVDSFQRRYSRDESCSPRPSRHEASDDSEEEEDTGRGRKSSRRRLRSRSSDSTPPRRSWRRSTSSRRSSSGGRQRRRGSRGGSSRPSERHKRPRTRSPPQQESTSTKVESIDDDDALSTNTEEAMKKRKRRTGWDNNPPAPVAAPIIPMIPTALSMTPTTTGFTASLAGKSPEQIQAELLERQSIAVPLAPQYKPTNMQLCRIYIGSLDYSLTDQDIRQVFSAFGTITNIDMPKEGTRSKGFCFVEYSTPEAAEMAITTMPGFNLKGRSIKVGRPTALGGQAGTLPMMSGTLATAKAGGVNAAEAGQIAAAMLLGKTEVNNPAALLASQDSQNRVYVGSVPYTFTADDVKQIFDVFGTILSCQLIPSNERPGTHRGYGFIEYSTFDEAKLAIETMNDFTVAGKVLKVNYATALRAGGQFGLSPSSSPTQAMLMAGAYGMPPPNSSPVLMLCNMVNPAEANNDLKEEIQQECSKYGIVRNVEIAIDNANSQVRILIMYDTPEGAATAVPALHDRWFGGRKIKASLYDVNAFLARNYWL